MKMGNYKFKRGYSFMVILLAIAMISITAASCSSNSNSNSDNQVVTVQRGNLNIDITGAGNLALSQTSDLAFETAGDVQEVSVIEGESVIKGQELAKLDTSEWNKQIETLNKALITAQRNLTSKQRAYNSAVSQVTAKELSARQSEIDNQTAVYNFNQISSIKSAQEKIDGIQNILDTLKAERRIAFLRDEEVGDYNQEIEHYTQSLDQANSELQDLLKGKNLNISTTVALQIAQSQIKLEQSRKSVKDAQTAVEDAKTAVTDAQLDITEAEQAVKDAQSDLDEAKNLSPIIIAPFDGFITKVIVKGGDEVKKGTVAMQIADPNKFKADITVGENDIVKVKEGGSASIQIDAISGITLTAVVNHISPTAAIQQGVVSYTVTVEVNSLQPAAVPSITIPPFSNSDSNSPTPPPASFTRTPGSVSPVSTPNLNPDQTGTTSATTSRFQRPNQQSQSGQNYRSQASNLTATPQASLTSEIRAGMSVTVSIIVTEKTNILLVPNQAITYNGLSSEVQVLSNGKTETRAIKTGVNNWQYTEVTDGLAEGDQVVIPASVNSTAATTQTQGLPRQQITIPNTGAAPGGGIRLR
jgi:HlyD family secretion protein